MNEVCNEVRRSVAAAMSKAAWRFSVGGFHEEAHLAYKTADELLPVGHHNADLSVLRHKRGEARGRIVEPIPATEDIVYAFYLIDGPTESGSAEGMSTPEIDGENLEASIRGFIDSFNPTFHRDNIPRDMPHIMVMSTGRCGTMSLYRLFQKSKLVPYHSYWWQGVSTGRWEAMCRFVDGKTNNPTVFRDWMTTRAAEWLGATVNNRCMIGLNHLDTIFAPAFAAVHPMSKFVYLKRDPLAVFESFYGKDQWQDNQLTPIDYTFDPGFRFHLPKPDLVKDIFWYITFTEVFCQAMGRIMGDRFIEIRSEDLFSRKSGKIADLLDFVGADIPLDVAVEHFGTKINEKTHKAHSIKGSAKEEFLLCQSS
jgi:hypothetical protein